MAVTLTVNQFYEEIPETTPCSYVLEYTLTWDPTETWTTVNVLLWGPQGIASDSFKPSFGTFSLTATGLATVTRTVTIAQGNSYAPLVQDPSFNEGQPPWTFVNATVAGSVLTLGTNSSATQKITLQPGTYHFSAGATSGSISLTINGFPYTSDTSFTVDDTPFVFEITSLAGATMPGISLTGTPVFPVIPPPEQEEFPVVPPSAAFPLYIVATDQNAVVQAALYITNVAPQTGSPQSVQAPVVVTTLDNTLTPVPTSPLQPSSSLNN
jgi:hypothetical protein